MQMIGEPTMLTDKYRLAKYVCLINVPAVVEQEDLLVKVLFDDSSNMPSIIVSKRVWCLVVVYKHKNAFAY